MALRKKYVNQAILLADSFNRRYSPITLDVPRVSVTLVLVRNSKASANFFVRCLGSSAAG
jgi:hypothetical protein